MLLLINIKLHSRVLSIEQIDTVILQLNFGQDVFFCALDKKEGKYFKANSIKNLECGNYVHLQASVNEWTLDIDHLEFDIAQYKPTSTE